MNEMQMCCNMQPFLKALNLIITLVRWCIPLLLIVLGTIDMLRAVAANDEKVVEDSRSTFIKRIMYGVLVFFVPLLVELVLNLIEDNIIKDDSDLTSANAWIVCWNRVQDGSLGRVCEGRYDDIYENDEGTNDGNEDNNEDDDSNSGNSGVSDKKVCYAWKISECNPKFSYDNTEDCSVKLSDFDGLIAYNKVTCASACLSMYSTTNYQYDYPSCVCYVPKIRDEVGYTTNHADIPSEAEVTKYLCSQTVNCDGMNFTGFCDEIK